MSQLSHRVVGADVYRSQLSHHRTDETNRTPIFGLFLDIIAGQIYVSVIICSVDITGQIYFSVIIFSVGSSPVHFDHVSSPGGGGCLARLSLAHVLAGYHRVCMIQRLSCTPSHTGKHTCHLHTVDDLSDDLSDDLDRDLSDLSVIHCHIGTTRYGSRPRNTQSSRCETEARFWGGTQQNCSEIFLPLVSGGKSAKILFCKYVSGSYITCTSKNLDYCGGP